MRCLGVDFVDCRRAVTTQAHIHRWSYNSRWGMPRLTQHRETHTQTQTGRYLVCAGLSQVPAERGRRARLDQDAELWAVLDLATNDELEDLYSILFGRSLLSPLVKSLVSDAEPPALLHRGRVAVMRRIEAQFRFLAADSRSTIRGRFPSYRQVLLLIVERLAVNCPSTLSTEDLEVEIFLCMMERERAAAQDALAQQPGQMARPVNHFVRDQQRRRPAAADPGGSWAATTTAPLRLGVQDLLPTLAKLAGAVTVDSMRTSALRQLGTRLVAQRLQYEATLAVLCRGTARGVAMGLQGRAALQAAQQGVTTAAARYSAVQGALGLLGPALWAVLGVDLALKAVGTDYVRVCAAVYALAQIRLTRTYGFSHPPPKP